MPQPRDWNAAAYDRISAPLEAMGRDVLDRLELRGDETVLDAGCGTGRVTAALLERLPNGRVIAVDGSPAMVQEARNRLGSRTDVRVADLSELELGKPVDAILSTATFHWIADHDRLFARLFAALRPGGALVAQCGGQGNIARARAAIDAAAASRPQLAGWAGPWHFAAPAATAGRLRAAGFADVWTWATTVRVVPEHLDSYFATVMLGAHLDRLAPENRDAFVADVVAGLEEPHVDYVRLNLLARRPAP
jgi:trans-aconitate 2-methyltransferase